MNSIDNALKRLRRQHMSRGVELMIIGLVGAGVMGRGIAQLLVQAGHAVRLFDARDGAAADARNLVIKVLERIAAKGNMSEVGLADCAARLYVASSLQELADCAVVVEAIIEDLGAKQTLFRELESVVTQTAILASNTSSLTVSAIAALCAKPGRVVGLHFFNPVPLMKIAEIIPGLRTEAAVVDELRSLIETTGHKTVTTRDQPGFLINHAGRGLFGEGYRIVEEGVADFASVDRIMRDCCGFRMGPFELMDLTGLDISAKVMQSIFDQFQSDPRYRPSSLTAPRIAAGLFGRKSGEGFYKYDSTQKQETAEPPSPLVAGNKSIFVSAGERRAELINIVANAGGAVTEHDDGSTVFLIMPWGEDITTACHLLGLDPARTVGVDPLLHWDRRRVVMRSPATLPWAVDAVHYLLAADGTPVTTITDSPGFVSQRIIAMIVNIGCEIAQRGIASAHEIDPAIRLGLGYPFGPLELGDRIGPARILSILQSLQVITGDPRYRPSLWLRRRAMLGISLLQAER